MVDREQLFGSESGFDSPVPSSFWDRLWGIDINDKADKSFKNALGDNEDRSAIYEELADKALNGIPLDERELMVLDFGLRWDESSAKPLVLFTLIPQLKNQEKLNPGSTQLEQLDKSKPKKGETFSTVLQGVAPSFGIGGSIVKALISPITKHPVASTLVGSALLGGFALGQVSPQEGQLSPQGESQKDPQLSPDSLDRIREYSNLYLVDGNTGETVEAPRGLEPDITDEGIFSGGYSQEIIDMAQGLGVDPAVIAGSIQSNEQEYGTLNSLYFGEIRLPLDSFPYGVDIRTGEARRPVGSSPPPSSKAQLPEFLRQNLPPEDVQAKTVDRSFVPPGGQINPSAFQKYGEDTLLSLVAKAAERHRVPVELLYGAINAQSGFMINAMTPDGNRVGLAQIDLVNKPYISRSQALNPRFSINHSARMLAIGTNRYGNFTGGVAYMLDPKEAKFLSINGVFDNSGTEAFVKDVYSYARDSGIGQYLFNPESVPDSKPVRRGGGGGGIKIPAYQAPDPASINQIVRLTYQDLYDRKPTEEEFASERTRLGDLFKDQYNAQVAKAQGKTSIAVDPQARFEERLRGSGEFGFREDTRDTRDVMSFMGDIVRIMQGV